MSQVNFRNGCALAGVLATSLIAGASPPWGTEVQVRGPRGGIVQVGTGGVGPRVQVRVNGEIAPLRDDVDYQPQIDPDAPFRQDLNQYRLGINYRGRRGGGVEITRVVPGTPADSLGLVPGQVIHSVNGRVVNVSNARREIFRSNERLSLIILEGRFWYRVTAFLEPMGAMGAAGAASEGGEGINLKIGGVKKERINNP